jgi:hypothetical protein
VAETWSVAELLRAGWSEADLEWERLAVATLDALAGGDAAAAQGAAGASVSLARAHFAADDPRLGTALANFAVAMPGGVRTGSLLAEAGRIWASCGPWIEAMTAPRSAKSSLFHMRMEARHRDTYRQRWTIKWRELADEARTAVAASAPGGAPVAAAPRLDRWRRECPAMLNDSRKLLAAVILLAAP